LCELFIAEEGLSGLSSPQQFDLICDRVDATLVALIDLCLGE